MAEDKNKASISPPLTVSIQGKQFRPGVSHEVVPRNAKEYLEVVKVHHEIEITRWCIGVMAACTVAFLATWFLWGFGLMPNITKDMVLWLGKGTLGVYGGALTTMIAAKFRKRK